MKGKLRVTTQTVTKIDSDDFNTFIEECYGGSFEFEAIQEANYNVDYEFSAPNMNNDFGGKVEASIREGKYPMWCVHALFNVLHKDGLIPAGTYLIKVDH